MRFSPLPARVTSAKALFLVALSSALYTACFAPLQWYWLAAVALVPLLVVLRSVSPARAALLAAGWSLLVSAGVVAPWLIDAASTYYAQPRLLGWAVFFVGTTVTASWAYALLGAGLAWAERRGAVAASLFSCLAFVAAELVRVRLGGNPVALFGTALPAHHWLAQVADLGGVYAVALPALAVNAAVAGAWLHLRRGVGTRRLVVGSAAVAFALVVASAGYGSWRLASLAPQGTTDSPIAGDATTSIVAVAQDNLELGSQWDERMYGRNLDVYLRMSHELLGRSGASVLFWPEGSMTFLLAEEPRFARAIAAVLEPFGAQLVAGGPRAAGSSRYFNSAFLLEPSGATAAVYDKQQLLPLAEYFPLGSANFVARRFAGVREFTPGGEARLLPTAAGSAGVLICNEAMFSHLAGDRARAGAEYLAVLSNDTWIGHSQYSTMQLGLAAFRAVEQRRFVVRASTAGPSAVIAPSGRVLAATEPFSRDTLRAPVQARESLTVYARAGDAFAIACLLLALLLLLPAPRARQD